MDEQRLKYEEHRRNAKKRGIEFEITFEEWKDIWSGKYHMRGPKSGQLGMLRTRDEGAYKAGNVRLGTPKENHQERAVCDLVSRAQNWRREAVVTKQPALADTAWIRKRYVFDEYLEEDE